MDVSGSLLTPVGGHCLGFSKSEKVAEFKPGYTHSWSAARTSSYTALLPLSFPYLALLMRTRRAYFLPLLFLGTLVAAGFSLAIGTIEVDWQQVYHCLLYTSDAADE